MKSHGRTKTRRRRQRTHKENGLRSPFLTPAKTVRFRHEQRVSPGEVGGEICHALIAKRAPDPLLPLPRIPASPRLCARLLIFSQLPDRHFPALPAGAIFRSSRATLGTMRTHASHSLPRLTWVIYPDGSPFNFRHDPSPSHPSPSPLSPRARGEGRELESSFRARKRPSEILMIKVVMTARST